MKKYYVDNVEVDKYEFWSKLNTGNYLSDSDPLNPNEERLIYSNEKVLERLRFKRKPLLIAFDKWEKAVIRGREEDSTEVMQWYQDLLDLKESAFENVPERINYYM